MLIPSGQHVQITKRVLRKSVQTNYKETKIRQVSLTNVSSYVYFDYFKFPTVSEADVLQPVNL